MEYVLFAFAISLILAPVVNTNQELITMAEIDQIFDNLTPDSIGGSKNELNLSENNLSNSPH